MIFIIIVVTVHKQTVFYFYCHSVFFSDYREPVKQINIKATLLLCCYELSNCLIPLFIVLQREFCFIVFGSIMSMSLLTPSQ